MASHSLVLECLRAVRFRLAKARSIMQANNLTPQVMRSIADFLQEESATYNARSALLLEMGVLAKNFSQATKTARTVKFYSPCFGLEPELARQPTTSTHQYGPVTAAPNRIDWELVHRTVDVLYTQLEGPLADAIAILENQGLDPKDEAAPLD